MNRVLVSGLGNASDMGLCDACDLNFSWLVHYPSILIWCDEICLPQNALKAQKSSNDSKNDLAIKKIMLQTKKALRKYDVPMKIVKTA